LLDSLLQEKKKYSHNVKIEDIILIWVALQARSHSLEA